MFTSVTNWCSEPWVLSQTCVAGQMEGCVSEAMAGPRTVIRDNVHHLTAQGQLSMPPFPGWGKPWSLKRRCHKTAVDWNVELPLLESSPGEPVRTTVGLASVTNQSQLVKPQRYWYRLFCIITQTTLTSTQMHRVGQEAGVSSTWHFLEDYKLIIRGTGWSYIWNAHQHHGAFLSVQWKSL